MDFIDKVKNLVLYAGFEQEQFETAKEQFFEPNRTCLMGLSTFLGLVGLALAIFSCFASDQVVMVSTLAYMGFAALNFGICFFAYKFGRLFPNVILPFCYVVLITCYALGIYAGCSHGPERMAVSIVAMVVILPVIFYDYALRLVLLDVASTVVFLTLSKYLKLPDVFVSDVVNVMPFTIVGCLLCVFMLRTKVNDLVQRKALIKQSEKIEELNANLVSRNTELENMIEQERLNTSVIRGLGNSFYALYYFEFAEGRFKEIQSIDPIRKIVGVEGMARDAFNLLCEKMVASENKAAIRKFTDYDTMKDRLRGKTSIAEEYLGAFSGWSRILIIPLSWEMDGSPAEAILCVRSINDEKKSQLKQENLQKVTESINAGLWNVEFDANGDVEYNYHSEMFRKMMGYSVADEYDTSLDVLFEHVHPDERELIQNAFWTSVYDRSDRIIFDVEFRSKLKNGNYNWFHAAGRVIRRADGSPISMIGVLMDINNQKEMELQLEKQQATLRDAFVAAQQASSAKSTFLNSMSHDIRTPLNAILGFSSLAETHLDNQEQTKDYINKISMAGRHLLELVNDVLDMSRIESGKVKIDESPANLISMAEEIQSMVNDSALAKGVNLTVKTSDVRNAEVSCDRLRLNQILLNLLGNSIKFSKEGGSVSFEIIQKGNVHNMSATYEFIVEDNGIGMSEEFQKHLFEPFEREKTSTVSGIQGTGLGLAICKNLVTMMGGQIAVTSTSGQGTRFSVSLPLKLVLTDELSKGTPAADELSTKSFEGLKVLLVEDNELNSEIAQSILQEAGFVVDAVEDGSVAVERIRTAELGQYDLILMDVQMPIMDGYEATRQIRAMHRSGISSLPIIAVTANAFEEDRLQALQAGMDGHVSKPIEIPKLMETLRTVLR